MVLLVRFKKISYIKPEQNTLKKKACKFTNVIVNKSSTETLEEQDMARSQCKTKHNKRTY